METGKEILQKLVEEGLVYDPTDLVEKTGAQAVKIMQMEIQGKVCMVIAKKNEMVKGVSAKHEKMAEFALDKNGIEYEEGEDGILKPDGGEQYQLRGAGGLANRVTKTPDSTVQAGDTEFQMSIQGFSTDYSVDHLEISTPSMEHAEAWKKSVESIIPELRVDLQPSHTDKQIHGIEIKVVKA